MTTSPILFLTFNRFDVTQRVFNEIRAIQPAKLYIASDGPRETRALEAAEVNRIRQYLTSNIDWPCELKLLFRDKNLGCKLGVSQAISWFFENEESGIILEDDCLPSQDFFRFCDELLEYYKNDQEIFMISGTNTQTVTPMTESYFYSAIGSIWGWASWRRAWKRYELNIKPKFNQENWKSITAHIGNTRTSQSLQFVIQCSVVDKVASTWDYQWLFCTLLANGKCIVPSVNLISNIGFGVDPTHTFDVNDPHAGLNLGSMRWPIIHPESKNINISFDALHASSINSGLKARTKALIKRILFKLMGRSA
jgi:hypothetical protein